MFVLWLAGTAQHCWNDWTRVKHRRAELGRWDGTKIARRGSLHLQLILLPSRLRARGLKKRRLIRQQSTTAEDASDGKPAWQKSVPRLLYPLSGCDTMRCSITRLDQQPLSKAKSVRLAFLDGAAGWTIDDLWIGNTKRKCDNWFKSHWGGRYSLSFGRDVSTVSVLMLARLVEAQSVWSASTGLVKQCENAQVADVIGGV